MLTMSRYCAEDGINTVSLHPHTNPKRLGHYCLVLILDQKCPECG